MDSTWSCGRTCRADAAGATMAGSRIWKAGRKSARCQADLPDDGERLLEEYLAGCGRKTDKLRYAGESEFALFADRRTRTVFRAKWRSYFCGVALLLEELLGEATGDLVFDLGARPEIRSTT
jgi:hypothetical protein